MRVALVQCPPWGSLPPLGIAALKAYLEPRGHPTTCIDLNISYCHERHAELSADDAGVVYARPDPFASDAFADWDYRMVDGEVEFLSDLRDRPLPIDRWADLVLAASPQVVGFSVQATNLGVTLQLARHLQRRDPLLRVVFGGPNVAQAQEGGRALRTGIPDAVVEAEGEETLVALLDAFEAATTLTDVAGIGLLVDGDPVWTPRRPLIADVDSLPFPDFSDFDWELYPHRYEIPIMSSRGCVLNCSFCYETVYWKRFRTQSPERIVAEIEHQIANHPLRGDLERWDRPFVFAFADSLVNGHVGGLRRTAQLMVDRALPITWGGQATVNTRMDAELFGLLAESGCNGLSFGLESGSPSVLASMGKKFDIAEAAAFFEACHAAGIKVVVNVMVGYPTETDDDFRQTLRFLRRIRRSIYMVNNVSPTGIPSGSRLHDAPEEFGVVPVDLEGWNSGYHFDWTSDATGTEHDRQRRARKLHRWMTLWRIPHQGLAPGLGLLRRHRRIRAKASVAPWHSVEGLPTGPPPPRRIMDEGEVQERIRQEAADRGAPPLLLVGAEEVVERVAAIPAWARPLEPEMLVGVGFTDLQDRLGPRLGARIDPRAHQGDDGVIEVHVAIDDPRSEAIAGLQLFSFPPPVIGGSQTLAAFPVPSAAAVEAP